MPKTTNPVTRKSGASINIVLTAIVLVVAVVVIGGVLLLNRGGDNSQASPGETVPASVLHPPQSNMVSKAPEGAPTLVEFVDYQCPQCYKYYQKVTSKIEKQYQGKINFVVRNYPLKQAHPLATTAASAVESAAMQGKFEEMYHQVFDNYQSWAIGPDGKPSGDKQKALKQFDAFAQKIGLDMDKFHEDMNSPQVKKEIQQDRADGDKAGVKGTPTFFLNGKQLQPSGNTYGQILKDLRAKLDGALAK